MIRTTCPQCGREDAVADYLASLPVMCKTCGHRVTMGEVIVPAKPVLPPPVLPPPKVPSPSVAMPPPAPAKPKPQPKPEPAVAVVAAPTPAEPFVPSEPPVHTNGAVLIPRPSFANAEGPGKVDLFDDDTPVSLARFERPLAPLPPPPPPAPVAAPGAHRGRRFAARLVTLVGAAAAIAAGILLVGFAPQAMKRDKMLSAVFLFVPVGLYALYNVALLASQGQDFGKRLLKLKVVGDDGTPARFGRAFLKRELVVLLLIAGMVPLGWKLYTMQQSGDLAAAWQQKGWRMLTRMPEVLPAVAALLFSVLNAAVIFNKDGKCIHDKLAKTTVVRSDETPTAPTPAKFTPPLPVPPHPKPPTGGEAFAPPPVNLLPTPRPAPAPPEAPRRGSLADFVTQIAKEPAGGVKKATLVEADPAERPTRDIPFLVPSSRVRRLGARILDLLLAVAAGVVGLLLVAFAPPMVKQSTLLLLAVYYTPEVIFWIVTLYLIAKNGQHIGKRILGIKIVRDDGSRVGLWRGFFRREFAYYLILSVVVFALSLAAELTGIIFALLPINIFAFLAGIANYLAIFRDSEQCLHDQLAGTIVVYDKPNS